MVCFAFFCHHSDYRQQQIGADRPEDAEHADIDRVGDGQDTGLHPQPTAKNAADEKYQRNGHTCNMRNKAVSDLFSVKVSTGSAQIKGRTEPALPTSKFSGQSGRMAKTVRRNQGRLDLAL